MLRSRCPDETSFTVATAQQQQQQMTSKPSRVKLTVSVSDTDLGMIGELSGKAQLPN
jgi:hypothetical protein